MFLFLRKRSLNRLLRIALASVLLISSFSGGILSSKVNAATWSHVHQEPGSFQYLVEYGNGTFMSLGYFLDYHLSTDSMTWDNRYLGIAMEPTNLKYLNSTWYITGSSGVYKTSNPTTGWTLMNPSLAGTHINDIAYNPVTDRYVLAGQDKLYSFTGSGTPEVVYVDNTIPNFYRLTYGNGMFIATTQIEGQGSKIYRSTDGLVWTQVYTTNPGQAIFDIAYGNSTFVAVGEGGRAYVSNDGENWSVSTLPNYTSLASVTYNSGEFYTVSTNERVATSLNGVAWVEEWSDSSSAIDFADISIGGGRAVAVGYDSQTYDGHIKSAPAPQVNSVTVTPTNSSVVQGGTEQLTATVDVSGGAAQTVTWSSSDTNGNVKVDGNGLVSVAANATPGPYTITATSTVDGTKSGSATVTVTSAPAVNSVTVTPTNPSVVQGGTEQLTATVDVVGGASQSVTWSSSDTNGNVTVDANGLVSVAANATPGPYTITATSTVDGTKSGSATINVVTQIKLYNVTINNLVDGTITATPINAPAGNVISLNILPDFGKRLKIGSLKYTYNSVDYPITGDVFIMPNGDVTISAEFEDISETIPFLSIVAPLFAPVTVGYEQPSAEKLIITNAGMVDTTIQSLTSSEPSTFVVEGSGENVAAGESIDTWTVRPVVGLPAGTYSSVITAVYGDGEIATTNLVLTVNPSSSSGGGGNSGNNGSGGGSQGGGTPSVDPPQPEPTGVPVIINGKSENIGKLETNVVENRSITTITPDPKKLLEWLAREGQNAIVTIPVNVSSDSIVGLLTGDVVKKMVDQSAVLELVTPLAIYRLPASQISIGTLADQLRADQSLSDMTIEVTISKAFPSETSIAKDSTNSNSALLLMDPVHFKLMAEFNGSRKEINRFNTYVERFITIPQTVDRNQITTGIVVGLDGSIHHVPTYVEQKDDRYYAVVNSLTNSLYTLVWHPVEFTDVTNHWAKSAINDMGSRMIATGVSEDIFEPNRDITRAEFAAMVIRALGLVPISGETPFIDVNKSDWFADYIYTAREYQLIEGYSNAQFAPMDTITREQAMTIIAKAMKITGIHPNLSPDQISMLLQEFKDESLISGYARDHIAAGLAMDILNGRTVTTIQPKNKITRAEVATLLQKLLKKSNLIQ